MQAKIIQAAISYAEAGYTVIRLRGKVPEAKNWTQADYVFPEDIPGMFKDWNGNFGVVLSRRDLVIDIDPRNFKTGDKPHARLFQECKTDIKKFGALARTGGGGLHIYLRLPATGDIKIRENHPDYPGVEFKSRGRQVVGVGGTHPDTKKPYEWAGGLPIGQILEAPKELLDIIKRSDFENVELSRPSGSIQVGASDEKPGVITAYTEYLQTAPAAVQGEAGDMRTFTVACKGRDLGLSEAKTFELMLEHYNPRCTPDWKHDELLRKVKNAYNYAVNEPGSDLPQAEFTKVKPTAHPLWRGWDKRMDGSNKLLKTINNVCNYFISSEYPVFVDSLAWDEFNGQVRILKKLPWHRQEGAWPKGGVEWRDDDSIQLRVWLSRNREFDVSTDLIDQAVLSVAQIKVLHPVRDYLRGLRWDGVPRLETWLIDYCGARDSAFVREAAKKFLLQAVSRIYNPGCKADHIVVLEGEQGVGKSSVVEILGGPWYGDIIIDPHSRDTVDAMRGKWIIEFSEMEAQNRHDAQAMKAFITRRVDRVRLAYGKRSMDFPRHCVFMGTMNPDATGEYLSDSTGNRRIWPVLIHKVKFDDLAAMRDQLFAEAADLVMKGEAIHIIDHEIIKEAITEQRKRQTTDPWRDIITEYMAKEPVSFVTTKDVWVWCLKGSESQLSVLHQRRIAFCLKECGFIPHVKREEGRLVRGFIYAGPEAIKRQLGDIFS